MTFCATILTLFPEMFPGVLGTSILGSALDKGLWQINTLHLRDFATDKHQKVDDTPYGGGAGMVMKPDVLDAAITHAKLQTPNSRLLYLSPRGKPLTQALAQELSQESSLILLCGRYEGVDERVLQHHAIEEISIGDYVLVGGEVAAMVLLEATLRLISGVLGEETSTHEESFATHGNCAGLLEYPHYTKPPSWKEMDVPPVLLSGHHQQIREWRLNQAKELTQARRPDLWERYPQNESQKKKG